MLLREETMADRPGIRAVICRAFADPQSTAEPGEADLLEALYECSEYLGEFSVVAEVDGVVAGYAIATRGWLDGDIPLLGLGPIAVDPEYQGRGMGGALLTEIRERATLAGERAILLLGHTGYYPRFGYVPAIPAGIMPSDPNWGEHFMVLALDQRTLPRGRFSYAAPFGV